MENNTTEDYSDVVQTLQGLFGAVVTDDVIRTVVESCGGDLNLAADAIVNISNDTTAEPNETNIDGDQESPQEDIERQMSIQTNVEAHVPMSSTQDDTTPSTSPNQPVMNYASAFRSTGAIPKQISPKPPKTKHELHDTEQFRRILMYHHQQGCRVLVIMRGLPGSGKSHLARQIVDATIGNSFSYKAHIYSTDDYFLQCGVYRFDKTRLSEAHEWNQFRVKNALERGISPIIVDNTNIEVWEMQPYAVFGVNNGYIIELIEPNTPWARKANQLVRKNIHGVLAGTIRRMLDNFQDVLSGDWLISYFRLSYPPDKTPPVIRDIPVFMPAEPTELLQQSVTEMSISENPINQNVAQVHGVENKTAEESVLDLGNKEDNNEEVSMMKRYSEIEKQLEEIAKVEQEWENGESWNEPQDTPRSNASARSSEASTTVNPKPPRKHLSSEGSASSEVLQAAVGKFDDWRMYMAPWNNTDDSAQKKDPETILETRSTGTLVEAGDNDIESNKKICKVIRATSRDINEFYISPNKEKIPAKRMLDKSTTTDADIVRAVHKCANEENHFNAFRKMFKYIPADELRDIFDKCCGDVNWAVDIVIGGMSDINNKIVAADNEAQSDNEEENTGGTCNCLAAYSIIPDTSEQPIEISEQDNTDPQSSVFVQTKRVKLPLSESSVKLKQQIEKSFVIADEHYSDHLVKLRSYRSADGIQQQAEGVFIPVPTLENAEAVVTATTDIETSVSTAGAMALNRSDDEDEDSTCSSNEEPEKTVNIHLGQDFIHQLDNLFGRAGLMYPENVAPKIKVPVSLLREINAFWLESFMHQLDDLDKQTDKMIDEDAELARQIAVKEAELANLGKEPDVPDLKEIMDMDVALALYQKDVDQWKQNEPNDLAAKLTRDKLYNLFPDVSKEILAELLMAHDNNFKNTVEVLLVSTGKASVLEEKNGLNKFVMQKEMERQEKLLQEEKQSLSEVEWPFLPRGQKVEMSTVHEFRDQANRHLDIRNLHIQKAQDYIRRGMTTVANYYTEVANFHKRKFEQANSLAAASLVQLHAENCSDNDTIDLHFLRVNEAKESLDMFIDTHIQKLRESASNNTRIRFHTLFFITGRGLHSRGGPRIKPAVRRRLRERGLVCTERNPGLLTARVSGDDKLSYQLNTQIT